MSINGKRDHFERADLISLADSAGIKKAQANEMIESVVETVLGWPDFAQAAGISETRVVAIQKQLRTNL